MPTTPREHHTMAESKANASGYVDCLAHNLGSLGLSRKSHYSERYRYENDISVVELKRAVLESESVKRISLKRNNETGEPLNVIQDEGSTILDRIAYDFKYSHLRILAGSLDVVLRKIFRHVYVNKDGMEEYCASFKDSPVVLLPTHSSYFDFILLTYVCFTLDLPIPAVASGEDFLNIAVVTRLIRGGGAFFLKRSFSDDVFYGTIFKEYTQQLLKASQRPLEFYTEGTRSRTGLALHPKLGMLSMVSGLFLRGRIPDVKFIPVGVSFECLAEEMLYVNEVLGIPKPKESFMGMLEAAKRSLTWDCGSVHLHFGEPISLSAFCNGRIDRNSYCIYPRNYTFPPESDLLKKEAKAVHFLGHQIVSAQQKLIHIFPRSILSASVIHRGDKVDIDYLTVMLEKMTSYLSSCRQPIAVEEEGSFRLSICEAVKLSSFLRLSSDAHNVEVSPLAAPDLPPSKFNLGQVVDDALLSGVMTYHALANQRNKLMGCLKFASMVAVCLCEASSKQQARSLDALERKFFVLHKMFKSLFVYEPDSAADIELAITVDTLVAANMVTESKQQSDSTKCIDIVDVNRDTLNFVASLIVPFLQAYWIIFRWFVVKSPSEFVGKTIPEVSALIQEDLTTATNEGGFLPFEAVSLSTIKSALSSLKHMGLITIGTSDTTQRRVITRSSPVEITSLLSEFGDLANSPLVSLPLTTVNMTVAAKL